MELLKEVSLISNEAIRKAVEYSENKEELIKLLEEIEITKKCKGYGKMSLDSKNTLYFEIEIKRDDKKIQFNFYQSVFYAEVIQNSNKIFHDKIKICGQWLNMQQVRKEAMKLNQDFLYSVLCSIKIDYSIPGNFEDFCSDFGYNEDSRKDYSLFEQCLKQQKKLKTIFKENEIECLPN